MNITRFSITTLFLMGIVSGALGHAFLAEFALPAHAQLRAAADPKLEQLAAEIEVIKGKLPSQSHTMQDVSYHFANLVRGAIRKLAAGGVLLG
jgi:hypothetical protein